MVDPHLLEQVLHLDERERREVRDAIDETLDVGHVSSELAQLLVARIADADAHPDDYITAEELERHLRARIA
jgi:hypothetical protein